MITGKKTARMSISLLALLILAVMLLPSFNTPAGAEEPAIEIEINGIAAVFTDAAPYIDGNSRTMVPVRFISENLGADVDWDQGTRTVTVASEGLVIRLQVGSDQIFINGNREQMDTRMVFNEKYSRNYVPLRFVSENLGSEIDWERKGGAMLIRITDQAERPAGTGSSSDREADREDEQAQGDFYGLTIGSSADTTRQNLGEPSRKDPSAYGYTWWIYNNNYEDYIQVGIKDNMVASLYSNSAQWEYQGIKVGSSRDSVRNTLAFEQEPQFKYDEATFTLRQPDAGEKDLFILGPDTALQVYYDTQKNNTVTAVRFSNLSFIIQGGGFDMRWSFPPGNPPDREAPQLTRQEQEAVDRANDRQLFDLVNAIRARKGLHTLQWHPEIAQVAHSHSVDMVQHNFFAHESPNTGDVGDRVRAAGIPFTRLRENIAHGQADAINAHEGLMNSPGHREAILHQEVNALGTGTYYNHYTQKFIKQ